MARVFLRLKVRLLAGGLRGTGRRVVFVLVAIAGLSLAVLLAVLFAVLPQEGLPVADLAAVVFAVFVVGWCLLPLLLFGSDETLDPARLALLPLTRRQLMGGLFTASLVGIAPLASFVAVLGVALGTADRPAALPVSVAVAALVLALCVAGSRGLASAFSGALRSRRGRDLALVVGLLGALAFQGLNIGGQLLLRSEDTRLLLGLAGVLRWTPPGLAAAAVADANEGRFVLAAGRLLVVGAVVVLLLVWWRASLATAMVTADASRQRRDKRPRRVRWERLLPDGPVGAVAVKELRYARRDPRRTMAWSSAVVVGLMFPLLFVVAFGGIPPGIVFATCFVALLIGLQSVNQLGLDGGAFWIGCAVAESPRDVRLDLAGRNLAVGIIAAPVLLLLAGGLGAMSSDLSTTLAAFAVACGTLGVAVGVSNLASVLAPYAVPERPTNAFSGPSGGQGCLGGVAALSAMLASALGSLPFAVLAAGVLLAWRPGPAWLVLVLLVLAGIGYGLAAAWAGRVYAARLLYPKLPEVLAEVGRAGAA